MTNKTKAEDIAADATEKMAAAGKETLETVMKMGADASAEGYKNAAAFNKEQLDIAKTSYDKVAVHGKENIDAISEASAAAVAGVEAGFENMVDYTKTAMAQNMEMMQRFFSAKTPQEVMDLQVEVANTAVNRIVSQSTKMNQIAADSAAKAFEPIKSRLDETVSAFVKPYVA